MKLRLPSLQSIAASAVRIHPLTIPISTFWAPAADGASDTSVALLIGILRVNTRAGQLTRQLIRRSTSFRDVDNILGYVLPTWVDLAWYGFDVVLRWEISFALLVRLAWLDLA
jgi:hypothetical protein